MKHRALGLAAALACLALAAAGVQSCASVLGVDSQEDVVAVMCVCNDQLRFLGNRAQCEETLRARLDGASEETRADWLRRFADKECAECSNVLDCYYTPPTCSTGACDASAECCGGQVGGKDTGYCYQNQCQSKLDCKRTGARCDSPAECCGHENGLALCQPFLGIGGPNVCHEQCSTNAENCPQCCAVLQGQDGNGELSLCIDPQAQEADCATLCKPGDECAVLTQTCNKACGFEPEVPGICVFLCQ